MLSAEPQTGCGRSFYTYFTILLHASRYVGGVLKTTASGIIIDSVPINTLANNQSLRCCLSKLGCACPRLCSQVSFTRNRLLLGVSASSASTTFSISSKFEFSIDKNYTNFLSSLRCYAIDLKAESFSSLSDAFAYNFIGLFFCDVLIFIPNLDLSAWCP